MIVIVWVDIYGRGTTWEANYGTVGLRKPAAAGTVQRANAEVDAREWSIFFAARSFRARKCYNRHFGVAHC